MLATREGTQVITTRVLNPEPSGSFSKIAIQMEIGGQVQQLASLIRGIESAPKLLVIDEINVRSLFRPVGFPQVPGAQPAASNKILESVLRLSALPGLSRCLWRSRERRRTQRKQRRINLSRLRSTDDIFGQLPQARSR